MHWTNRRGAGVCVLLLMAVVGLPADAQSVKSGKSSPGDVEKAVARAQHLLARGKRKAAAEHLEAALQAATSRYGPSHLKVAKALDALADVQESRGYLTKSVALRRRSVAITEKKLGANHSTTSARHGKLAKTYVLLSRWTEADDAASQWLKSLETMSGSSDAALIAPLRTLATIRAGQSKWAEAEELCRRGLTLAEAKSPSVSIEVVACLDQLGVICRDTFRFADAARAFERGIALIERIEKQTAEDPEAAAVHGSLRNNQADLRRLLGQFAEAQHSYQHAAKVVANLRPGHPLVVRAMNGEASLHRILGKDLLAEPIYRRALQAAEKANGKAHPAAADCLHHLGSLFLDQGRRAPARYFLELALARREKALGAHHPDVARTLVALGVLEQSRGRHAKARPLYQRSRGILEAKLGRDHPELIAVLNNLALAAEAEKDNDRAASYFERATAIAEKKLGPDHPRLAELLTRHARFVSRTGSGNAAELLEKARGVVARYSVQVLPMLSEMEQGRYQWLHDARELEMALAYGMSGADTSPPQAASWLLAGKAAVEEALIAKEVSDRLARDPQLGKSAAELHEVREQLARIAIAMPPSGSESFRDRAVALLRQRQTTLTEKLGLPNGAAAEPRELFEKLSAALPSSTAFIDIARIRPEAFAAGTPKEAGAPHYVAWITLGRGVVRMVDLGPAGPIDAAVAAARDELDNSLVNIRNLGEAKAEALLRKKLMAASNLILDPLLPQIRETHSWIISPAGSLWLLPWAALPEADNGYAIQKHRISYAVTGRDLLRRSNPRKGSTPLVVADPDFNLSRREAISEAAALLRGLKPTAASCIASGGLEVGECELLPGTLAEVAAVAPPLKALAGIEPRLLIGRQALKEIVSSSHGPRFLVLSTHAYFLPVQEQPDEKRAVPMLPAEAMPTPRTREGRVWESSLRRFGLLLAGCNDVQAAGDAGDDGVLSGVEIADLDLRGTELVVAPQCQTGAGEMRNGQAFAELHQALRDAGAASAIVSQWQLPGAQSGQLLRAVLERLAAGKSPAAALREAQLAAIQQHKTNGGVHPFFWAGFTLSGGVEHDAVKSE